MKVTKTTIKKAIKELKFNLEDFEINRNEIETALEDVEKGNKQVKKIVKHLVDQGASYNGFKTGYGAWNYTFESRSYSQELASMNID